VCRAQIGGVGNGFGENPTDENTTHQRPFCRGLASVICAGEESGRCACRGRDYIHDRAVEQ